MTTKEKYEMIDKSKVPSKTLEILEKMQKASTNFTNPEVNAKIDSALDRLIEGFKANNPSALITASQAKEKVKKEKTNAQKKNEGKDLSEKKDTDDKTGLPKKDTVDERKDIIKKESESEKEARERAKKELEKENEKAKDVIESQLEKLNRIILEDPALQGFNKGFSASGGGKSTPIIDAERKALPRGKRVSKKGWKNQYGASDGGRTYWENRENRTDRKSPDYPTGKPYLAKGGNVYSSDDVYEVKMVQDGVELDSKFIRAKNKGEARMIFEDMYQEKYQDEFGAFELEIDVAKSRLADGGYMEHRGTITDDSLESILKSDFPKSNYQLDHDNISGHKIYGQKDVIKTIQKHLLTEYGIKSEYYKEGFGLPFLRVYSQFVDKYAQGGKTEQFFSSIQTDRLRVLEDEIATVNLMLKKLQNINTEEAYQEGQNLREYKAILEVKKINLEDGLKNKGGYMADGENYEYVNTFKRFDSDVPVPQDDFEKLVDAYHKQLSGDKLAVAKYNVLKVQMGNYLGEKTVEEMEEYIQKTHEAHKMAHGGEVGSWESLTIEKMQKDFPFDLKQLNRLLKDACKDRDDAVITNFQLSWMSKKYDTFANLVYDAGIYLKSTGSDNVSPSGTYHSQKGLSITFYLRQTYRSNGSMSSISIDASTTVAGGMEKYKSINVANYSDIYKYISAILRDNPKNNLGNSSYAKGGMMADGGSLNNGNFEVVSVMLNVYDQQGDEQLYEYLQEDQGLDIVSQEVKDYRKEKGVANEYFSENGKYYFVVFKKADLRNVIGFEKMMDEFFVPMGMKYTYSEQTKMSMGGFMAHGGEVDFSKKMEKMQSAYETLDMIVKSKIAMAIGIDNAISIMDTDYVVHPFHLIKGAVTSGLLEIDEINGDLVGSAIQEAGRIDEDYRDSGEGIGSSDITYFTKYMLRDAGYKTEFINHRLKRVDDDGNELVINKYEMDF